MLGARAQRRAVTTLDASFTWERMEQVQSCADLWYTSQTFGSPELTQSEAA